MEKMFILSLFLFINMKKDNEKMAAQAGGKEGYRISQHSKRHNISVQKLRLLFSSTPCDTRYISASKKKLQQLFN